MRHGGALEAIAVLAACVTFAGCSAEPSNGPQPNPGSVCAPGAFGCAAAGTTGGAAGTGLPIAGSGTLPPSVAGTGGTSAGTAGQGPAPAQGGVPCDVASIVSSKCTGCHSAVPKFSAPMPLMTLADFQAMARSDTTRHVYQVIPERIDPTDVARRMPPTSLPELPQTEKDTLNAWVAGGALGATASCPITETNLVPPEPMDGGVLNPGGSGGAHVDPIEYDDPDMECYKFVAHASGGTGPYMKTPGEQYMNFDFAAPWQGTMYQRAIKLVIDPNSTVIHHWLLFKQTGAVRDGAISPGSGTHPDGILLHGWAPGASPIYLDPDVGVELPSSVGYRLEIHYYNMGATAGADQSGAEVCVTPHAPEHLAELSWVGSDSITGTSATGRCAPRSNEPIHIIAAQPHMHLKGRHMKVVVNRSGGMAETIHDEDFMFENQRYYVLDTVLMPGDTMTTSCTYSAPSMFGSSTNQEMCYFFSLAWPAGALRSAGVGTALHGANSCL